MAYMGSEAYRLDSWGEPDDRDQAYASPYQRDYGYGASVAPRRDVLASPQRARSLRPLEGGHLDARARAGVSAEFWYRVKVALVVAACALALGFAHVTIRQCTVVLETQNAKLETQVSQTEEQNQDLLVTRSVLSSADRIGRIAEQNYGMVRMTPSATIQVSG